MKIVINKRLKKIVKTVLEFGKDFCKRTSIHGFNHVAAKKRHWTERILWLCIVTAATWGAVEISLGQLQRFNESPTVVTLQKDFRSWNYSLPSVTICYLNRLDETKLPAVIESFWNVLPNDPKYDYYSRFVSVVANSSAFDLEGFKDYVDDESLNVDLYKLAVEVMPQLQVKPLWSVGAQALWTPVMTEAGACYTINSVAIADIAIDKTTYNDSVDLPITCKNSKLNCYAMFEVSKPTNFYFHSPYDILDGAIPPSRIQLAQIRQIELEVLETRTGRGIRELSPHRRGCLYTDEPTSKGKKVYSTNSCRLTCRSRIALESKCRCRPFLYPNAAGPSCTPSGLYCLSALSVQLAKIEPDVASRACSCSQQCVDAVYEELSIADQYWSQGPFGNQGSVRIVMKAPMTRYTREIVFHFHDLVVSFGGAAGLFLGASFISLVEIIYFLLERITRIFDFGGGRKETLVAPVTLPHEAVRVLELTAILNEQRRLDFEYLQTTQKHF